MGVLSTLSVFCSAVLVSARLEDSWVALMKNETWHRTQHGHAVKAHAEFVKKYPDASYAIEAPIEPKVVDAMSPQYAKMRITNGGSQTIWINYQAQGQYWTQTLRLNPGQAADYNVPGGTVAGTRFWPKQGCDWNGQNCAIGESGGPNLPCPTGGCSPPIDSKFEATFGASDGNDWYDASQVDGWTLPYQFAFRCGGETTMLNCQSLSAAVCPTQSIERLGTVSLLARNPRSGNSYAGCYSPCAKLTYSNWGNGPTFNPNGYPADKYCCAGAYDTNPTCWTGPDPGMTYTQVVHSHCDAYAWAYDDAVGLKACPSGQVSYQLTFYNA